MSEQMVIQSHRGPYTVEFAEDAFDTLARGSVAGKHFIVDANVARLYRAQLAPILDGGNCVLVDAVEGNKSLERLPGYVQQLVEQRVRRGHVLVAIGGGITQDITCFLASTLLRGVEWVFYPTTLLAQADSCIGSKSSINCGSAKNILGTFTPPREIFLTTRVHGTLSDIDIRSGIGEMLKVHAIAGPDHFDRLAADYTSLFTSPALLGDYIRASLEIKRGYIERDEFDTGPRNIFNYGHSFGHAIEAATDFAIPHGIAVTIGMDMANYTSWQLGVGGEDHYRRMTGVLRANYRGFESFPIPVDEFLAALAKDKKNVGATDVALILPDKKAEVFKGNYPADSSFKAICTEFLTKCREG